MSKQWEVKDNGKADAYHPLESMNKWILAYVQSDKHLSANQRKHIGFIVEAVNSHQAMKEALGDLIRAAELVAGDVTDQDTGWYYQLQGRIQDGLKALALANGKGSES